MSLVHRLPRDRDLDVRRLVVESAEAKPDVMFDVGRDLTEEDWRVIKDKFDHSLEGNPGDLYLVAARDIKRLSPKKLAEFGFDEQLAWNLSKRFADIWLKHEPIWWEQYLKELARVRELFPDRLAEFDVDQLFKNIPGHIERAQADLKGRSELGASSFLDFCANTSIVFPRHSQEGRLEPAVWKMIEDEYARKKRDVLGEVGLCDFLVKIRLAFPEHFKTLAIDQGTWNKMKNNYEKVRRFPSFHHNLVHRAAEMQLAAAYDVKPTEHGLDIIMYPPKLRQQLAPPPGRRNF